MQWLTFLKAHKWPNLITSFNSANGPPKLLNCIPDGISYCVDGSMNLAFFNGCAFHSCFNSEKPCKKATDKSIFNTAYSLIRKKFDTMIRSLRRTYRINEVEIMPECKFKAQLKDETSPIGQYFKNSPYTGKAPETFLRGSLRGGRCEAHIKSLSLGEDSVFEVVYDDLNSLFVS